jgi:hypothetical protein
MLYLKGREAALGCRMPSIEDDRCTFGNSWLNSQIWLPAKRL